MVQNQKPLKMDVRKVATTAVEEPFLSIAITSPSSFMHAQLTLHTFRTVQRMCLAREQFR